MIKYLKSAYELILNKKFSDQKMPIHYKIFKKNKPKNEFFIF